MSRRERECGTKKQHTTREQAERAIDALGPRAAAGTLAPYRCSFGEHWHTGHRGGGTNGRASRSGRRMGRRGRNDR